MEDTASYLKASDEAERLAKSKGQPIALVETKYGYHPTPNLEQAVVIFYPNGNRQYLQ